MKLNKSEKLNNEIVIKNKAIEYLEVYDHQLIHLNGGKGANIENSLIFKNNTDYDRKIDFEICARNYCDSHPNSSGKCIGESNCDSEIPYFIFYTSGIRIKVIFKKRIVLNIFHYRLFNGGRKKRFLQLQKLIENKTDYCIFDLS